MSYEKEGQDPGILTYWENDSLTRERDPNRRTTMIHDLLVFELIIKVKTSRDHINR